jgi:protein phosphatase
VDEKNHAGTDGYQVGTRTDVGRRRQRNEDYLGVDQSSSGLLLIVCDGMGGQHGAQRATRLAVQTFVEDFGGDGGDPHADLRARLEHAVARANAAVFNESSQQPELSGMGTTLVAALVRDGEATIVNVGDSRAYRWHAGRLERVTSDHSVVEELVAAGKITSEQARIHPQRNLITRALGTGSSVQPDLYHVTFGDGDAILLASDGLHGMIPDARIASILASERTADAACDALVHAALEAGGDDNVSVALVRSGVDMAALAGPTTDPGGRHRVERPAKRGGSAWLWLVLGVVAAAAAWLLLVARPWERAGELAPQSPSPSIGIDTSLSEIDSVEVDSTSQATPFDDLRGVDSLHRGTAIDTLGGRDSLPVPMRPSMRPARPRDSTPPGGAVTGRR